MSNTTDNTNVKNDVKNITLRKLKRRRYLPEGGSTDITQQRYVRQRYTDHWDFLFSCLGSTVGHGSMWTFPVLAAEYGGIYFLVTCFVMMVFVTAPMSCLEMFLGQLSGLGIAKTLGLMTPLFHGVGWAMTCLTFLQSIRFGVLIGYNVFYLCMTFKDVPEWMRCDRPWNTPACLPLALFYKCTHIKKPMNDSQCWNFYRNRTLKPIAPTEEFFYNYILNSGHGRGDDSTFSWQLALALLFAYVVIFSCLAFGIRISSKIVYITVTFPYVGFLLILIVCLKLGGAASGVKIFFAADYHVLFQQDIWIISFWQMIWSTHIGTGLLTALASYNPFHNDCKRDSLILGACNLFVSFLGSTCLFAATGIITKNLRNMDMKKFFTKYDQILTYIVYPELISRVSGASHLTGFFFLVVIVLLLNSEIWIAETCLTEIADVYKPCRSGRWRVVLVGLYCIVSYVISVTLFCVKDEGGFNFSVLRRVLVHYSLMLFAFLELVAVFYIYGYHRFEKDIKLIVGRVPNVLWRTLFLFTAPSILLVMLIDRIKDFHSIHFKHQILLFSYHVAAIFIQGLLICVVFAFPVYYVVKTLNKKQNVISLLMPSKKWCPRKKADLEIQRHEISSAEKGIMGDFDRFAASVKKSVNTSIL